MLSIFDSSIYIVNRYKKLEKIEWCLGQMCDVEITMWYVKRLKIVAAALISQKIRRPEMASLILTTEAIVTVGVCITGN
jgi:hypothetical protein